MTTPAPEAVEMPPDQHGEEAVISDTDSSVRRNPITQARERSGLEGALASDPPLPDEWVCIYDPTFDQDWHNDVLCRTGEESERPYLRDWDDFVTRDEILESAKEYEDQLNGH